MAKKENQDDWDFSLDEDATLGTSNENILGLDDKNVGDLKKKVKRRPVKKKVLNDLSVEHTRRGSVKKSRRAVARELNTEKTKTDIYKVKYCSKIERITAGGIDLALLVGIVFGSHFISPMINKIIDDFLIIITSFLPLTPEFLAANGWIGVSLIGVFILYIVPSILFKRSIGKSFLNLYVGKNSQAGRNANFAQAIMRELVFKPISILSIFGLLMMLVNRESRALHDRLSGTAVLKK